MKALRFVSQRPFGVELEYNRSHSRADLKKYISEIDNQHEVVKSSWTNTTNNNYWNVKTDSSCGDTGDRSDGGGYEVASFVGRGHKDLFQIVKVVEEFERREVQINKFCGLHIHTQVKDYDENLYKRSLLHWYKMEPIIFAAVPSHRKNNKHCKSIRSCIDPSILETFDIDRFWKHLKPKSYNDTYRKRSINYANSMFYESRCTLELRLPENSSRAIDVKNWVRLFVNFISNVKNTSDPDSYDFYNVHQTLRVLGLSYNDKYTISPGLYETKIWFLKRIMDYSDDVIIRDSAIDWLKFYLGTGSYKDVSKRVLGEKGIKELRKDNKFINVF